MPPPPRELKRLRRAFVLLSALLFVLAGAWQRLHAQIAVVGDGGPGPVKAQHLTAEMVSVGPSIAPGGKQIVGLVLTLEDGWHVYWVNAGDSGEPPQIDWTLPEGFKAGRMQFPIPERLPLGPLMDFGYEDHVALPVTIAAPASAPSGVAHLDAQVSWLVCQDVCLPGKAHLGLDLNVQPNAPDPAREAKVGALGEALTTLPKPLPSDDKIFARADANRIAITLVDGYRETEPEFYPFDHDTNPIVNAAEQAVVPHRDGATLYLQRSPQVATLPPSLHGLLKLSDNEAYDVTIPVVMGALTAPAASPHSLTAVAAIGLAFLGGIILNLMPCVFPVLFLKALGLVQTTANADEKWRRGLLAHGLVYALGIVLSFWAIVGALLAVRAGGHHAGWGFQLQSPAFLAVLASFLFLFALSLAGQFDIGLSLTSAGGSLAEKHGYAGSFFTGVLATVVATPCTAPLMGAAVGFALAQPAIIAFAVFTALAVGLALPYVLLSWQPAWARLLPKPGSWMEVLKQLTAIPLFATTIWLVWVYGQLFAPGEGVSQIAFLLTGFLVLAIAGWALGRWPAKRGSRLAAVALIVLAVGVPLRQIRLARRNALTSAVAANSSAAASISGPLVWQPYSEETIAEARAAGRPVFIDFTAAWCLSCQVNERLVLKSPEVQGEFRTRNFALLRADWTNEDDAITKKLASLGRAGVPTYVIYPAAQTGVGDVLPELLTKDIVLKAIRKDAP
jgi:thiol:disulfide interchange protein